jgi:hypothetical protein
MPVFVVGRTPVLVVGRVPVLVVGRMPVFVVGRTPVLVVGRMPVLVVGRMPVLVVGRAPVIGRAPVLLAGRAFVAGLAVFVAGCAAGFAGAGFAGAALGGGDEPFFWSPQTSAEVSISVKSTISFLGIRWSNMFPPNNCFVVSIVDCRLHRPKQDALGITQSFHAVPKTPISSLLCPYGCALWPETFS